MSQSSLTLLSSAPDVSALPTLAAHQASTPATFTQEVLHFQTTGAKLTLSSDQKFLLPAWFPDAASNDISVGVKDGGADAKQTSTDESKEGEEQEDEDWEDEDAIVEDVHVEDVTVIVTTKHVSLFSPSHSAGYQIEYPSISLHAITSTPTTSGIYMQINTHSTSFDDHDFSSLEVTIYPPQTTLTTSAEGGNVTGSTKEMFEALTKCSDLHPDTKPGFFGGGDGDDEDIEGADGNGIIYFDHSAAGDIAGGGGIKFLGGADEIGGIPALAPGGWITAENVDSIQWTIDGQSGVGDPNSATLGPGAGNVRRREDGDEENVMTEENGTNGTDVKWRRTD
ncbi:hypothetical protein H072_6212 [Dactylellina haptotyla CBS 200.50]|uniref:Protein LOT5 n=1 Tax=Dactylellina haptotyla (strain CBS 200.50) TaxID=1284197 RepID=S8AAG5_DACHA|nr:hypothetical protein H072_6212 [Dactylellina haptotyla CBS 200.50]